MKYICYGTPGRKKQSFRTRKKEEIITFINNFLREYANEKQVNSFEITVVNLAVPSIYYAHAVNDIESNLTVIKKRDVTGESGPTWEIEAGDFPKAVLLLDKYLKLDEHLLFLKIEIHFTFSPQNKFIKPHLAFLKEKKMPEKNNLFFILSSIQALWMNFNFPFDEIGANETVMISEIESLLKIKLNPKNFLVVTYDEQKDKLKTRKYFQEKK